MFDPCLPTWRGCGPLLGRACPRLGKVTNCVRRAGSTELGDPSSLARPARLDEDTHHDAAKNDNRNVKSM
jgi:hypothetical protein